MGKPVNRASDGSDNPAVASSKDPIATVLALMAAGESKVLEYKSTARVNLRTGSADPATSMAGSSG